MVIRGRPCTAENAHIFIHVEMHQLYRQITLIYKP